MKLRSILSARSLRALLLPAAALALVAATQHRAAAPDRWWEPGADREFPASLDYRNEHGTLRTLLVDGPMQTKNHPFFMPLGANGRACVTC